MKLPCCSTVVATNKVGCARRQLISQPTPASVTRVASQWVVSCQREQERKCRHSKTKQRERSACWHNGGQFSRALCDAGLFDAPTFLTDYKVGKHCVLYTICLNPYSATRFDFRKLRYILSHLTFSTGRYVAGHNVQNSRSLKVLYISGDVLISP